MSNKKSTSVKRKSQHIEKETIDLTSSDDFEIEHNTSEVKNMSLFDEDEDEVGHVKKMYDNKSTLNFINESDVDNNNDEMKLLHSQDDNESENVATKPKRLKQQKENNKSSELGTCACCCDDFNAKSQAPITCPRCPYKACKACHKKYLLNSISTPHCMSCRNRWTYKDLLILFKRSFVNVTFRKQRGCYLLDRAKSHLPLAMPYAESEKKVKELRNIIKGENSELLSLRRFFKHNSQYSANKNEYEKNKEKYNKLREIVIIHQRQLNEELSRSYVTGRQRQRMKRRVVESTYEEHCPVAECRGFVDKNTHFCGLCKTYVCHKCAIPLGKLNTMNQQTSITSYVNNDKGDDNDNDMDVDADVYVSGNVGEEKKVDIESSSLSADEKKQLKKMKEKHECKEEDIESIKEIRAHTRQCPNCKTRIYRIAGCDTMWCVQCHTGFNWRTGLVITNTRDLHNPHYIEFIRQNPNFSTNQQEMKRNDHNQQPYNPCDQFTLENIPVVDVHVVRSKTRHLPASTQDILLHYQQQMAHMRDYGRQKFVEGNQYDEVEFALRYLVGTWNEKIWRIQVEHHDRFRQTNQEYQDVLLTWLVVMNDLFTNYSKENTSESEWNTAIELLKQIVQITEYTNQLLSDMNLLYNRKTTSIVMKYPQSYSPLTDLFWGAKNAVEVKVESVSQNVQQVTRDIVMGLKRAFT